MKNLTNVYLEISKDLKCNNLKIKLSSSIIHLKYLTSHRVETKILRMSYNAIISQTLLLNPISSAMTHSFVTSTWTLSFLSVPCSGCFKGSGFSSLPERDNTDCHHAQPHNSQVHHVSIEMFYMSSRIRHTFLLYAYLI